MKIIKIICFVLSAMALSIMVCSELLHLEYDFTYGLIFQVLFLWVYAIVDYIEVKK